MGTLAIGHGAIINFDATIPFQQTLCYLSCTGQ